MTELPNPFIEYRQLLDLYQRAVASGVSDAAYCRIVDELDAAVATVAGIGFRVTPAVSLDTRELDANGPDNVVAKFETGNVGGSHKARHLFGLLLDQRFRTEVGGDPTRASGPWAIASCGNAALAAAVVARAVGHRLDVFVPADADPGVLEQLETLDAHVTICHRDPDQVGDPCIARLESALGDGAIPFTVQGTTCPGAFDGARTLGAELADQAARGDGTSPVTDLYIQVGGGAFAVATAQGWERRTGRIGPRLHPVQPTTAHPLIAAWQRLVPDLLQLAHLEASADDPVTLGRMLAEPAADGLFDDLLATSTAMQAWPTTPSSIASGILDDVTYDWRPLVALQLRSAGWPVTVTEEQLELVTRWIADRAVSDRSAPPPDATGAAGLAGAVFDQTFSGAAPSLSPRDARGTVAVVVSGVDRSWSPDQ